MVRGKRSEARSISFLGRLEKSMLGYGRGGQRVSGQSGYLDQLSSLNLKQLSTAYVRFLALDEAYNKVN